MEWTYDSSGILEGRRQEGDINLLFRIHEHRHGNCLLQTFICGGLAKQIEGDIDTCKRIGETFDVAKWREFETHAMRQRVAQLKRLLVYREEQLNWWEKFGFIGVSNTHHTMPTTEVQK